MREVTLGELNEDVSEMRNSVHDLKDDMKELLGLLDIVPKLSKSIEKLETEYVDRSKEIAELFTALSKAQGEIQTADKSAENPHFGKMYADLASVWDACRGPLSKNGLGIIQLPKVASDGKSILITTVLSHSSGQYINNVLRIFLAKFDAHGIGSAITYGRRYALSAMVGIAPAEDDANAAVGKGEGVKQEKEKERQRAPANASRPQTQTKGLAAGPTPKPDFQKYKEENKQAAAEATEKAKTEEPKTAEKPDPDRITTAELKALNVAREKAGWTADDAKQFMGMVYNVKSSGDLKRQQVNDFFERMKKPVDDAAKQWMEEEKAKAMASKSDEESQQS